MRTTKAESFPSELTALDRPELIDFKAHTVDFFEKKSVCLRKLCI